MLKHTQPRLSQLASAVAVVLGGITLLPAAHAAAPAAGVSISNIAVANYVDATGAPQTVSSNEVRTTVLQVASFTLVADRTATVNANGQVALSHTLTNTGNGTDSFIIDLENLVGDTTDLNNIAVYIDTNGDGVADNNVNLIEVLVATPNNPVKAATPVSVAAGQSVNLIVVGTAPLNATNGQVAELRLSASSVFTPAVTAANTDSVTVVGGAVVNLVKTASVALGLDGVVSAGDEVTYTIAYNNTGNTNATNVVITDLLPANVTYIRGSARLNGTTVLGDDIEMINSDGYNFNLLGRELSLTLPTLAQNTNGTLTFKVSIDAGAVVGSVTNVALVDYNDGAGNTVTDRPSNGSSFTVAAVNLGTINDSTNDPFADNVAPSFGATPVAGDTVVDDVQTVAAVPQGGTTSFPVVVHNTGNVSQVYEVTVNQTGLPVGSTVTVLRNGAPLTNISGTTAVDVGPIAVGGVATLSVVINLPSTAPTTMGPYVTAITISPIGNETATDSTTLVIQTITAATVDITDGGNMVGDGFGPYNPNITVNDLSAKPGVSVMFPVSVSNTGGSPDNFNLTAMVPPGFTVTFLDANGAPVTNTGNVPAGETRNFTAVVTPPANAPVDPTNDVILTVTSPVSGLTDSIKNNVNVIEARAVDFTPDRQGQVAPNGTVTHTHTLVNNGNVVEGGMAGALTIDAVTAGNIGSITTIGIDLNNDGDLQVNEIIRNGDVFDVLNTMRNPGLMVNGLQPFTSYPVLVKVQAPNNATPGAQDITTITVKSNGLMDVDVVDTTTVTAGNVRLVKTQALDHDCNGMPSSGPMTSATYTQGVIEAAPGQCVVYRIVATNAGNLPVTNVVITDATPAFTTIHTPATVMIGTAPATPAGTPGMVGMTGTVGHSVNTLAPSATVQLDFGVQIDPITP